MKIRKQDLQRLDDYVWAIPTSFHPEMNVPVWIFADDELLEDALGDLSLTQGVNVACLPGLVGHVAIMPDVHLGYGMPIGGVMAAKVPEGIISPGAAAILILRFHDIKTLVPRKVNNSQQQPA